MIFSKIKPLCRNREVSYYQKLRILSSVGDYSLRFAAPTVFGMVIKTLITIAQGMRSVN